MPNFDTKRIACPVHATIRLGSNEARILDTRPVQRLRNVKQLGLAHYVFPGGDFSRFSHSLGVLHVASSMLQALRGRRPDVLTENVIEDLRLAALVHDIGHLPFSHTMEYALRSVYEEPAVPIQSEDGYEEPQFGGTLKHEEIGALILQRDPELSRILPTETAERIGRIIQGDSLEVLDYPAEQAYLGRLVSSDLDADRIDYLMRTARHTGLPYGGLDLSHLMSQIRLDDDHQVCFGYGALNAVDHCLIGRYFDRVAIAFHKTVAGLELLLQDVIRDLIRHDLIHADRAAIERQIETGEWADFDDLHVTERMRNLRDLSGVDPPVKARLDAILHRNPPRLLAQLEYVAGVSEQSSFQTQLDAAQQLVDEWNEGREGSLYLWKQDGFTITSLASSEAEHLTQADLDESEERPRDVRILVGPSGRSRSIRNIQSSLMTALGDKSYYAVRIYALSSSTGSKVRGLLRERLTDGRWYIPA